VGAELIGFMLKGPRIISVDAKRAAANKLLLLSNIWNSDNSYTCPVCGERYDDIAETIEEQSECGTCITPFPSYYKDIKTADQALQWVNGLVAEWPPEYRDCYGRTDPDDKDVLTVFAGDFSWGDEPEGMGYLALKNICNSGISEELGIR